MLFSSSDKSIDFPFDREKIGFALASIKATTELRDNFVECLLDFENKSFVLGFDIREKITGPLIDALYEEGELLSKNLSNGLKFEFLYRSKIARDFVMSDKLSPDHVWEPQTTRFLLHFAKVSHSIVVGGAYCGDHVVLLTKAIQSTGGKVHAFEPNEDQRNMLQRNLDINSLDNALVRPEGLWRDSFSKLKLVGYDSFANVEECNNGFATISINDYFSENPEYIRPDLIMLDIEGAEFSALQGASNFLALPSGESPLIVFELHRDYVDWDNGLESTEIIKFLSGFGYSIYALRDYHSNKDMSEYPIELIPADSVYLEGPSHGFNMVAAKDDNFLKDDFLKVCYNVSPKLLRHRDPTLHAPIHTPEIS